MAREAMSLEEQVQVGEKNLERVLEWVGRFDPKASVVLGVDTAMVGALVGFAPDRGAWTTVMVIVGGLALLFLFISLLFLCVGSYPRMKAPSRSLLYFGTVGKMTLDEYRGRFLAQDPREYLEDLLQQCHRNCQIVRVKFWSLQYAYGWLVAAVVPWAFAIYLFKTPPVPQ